VHGVVGLNQVLFSIVLYLRLLLDIAGRTQSSTV